MSVRVPAVAVGVFFLALLSSTAAPAAARAKSPSPAAPTNLRITATTSSSATLAWDAPKGGSGISYYGVLNTATWTYFTVPSTETAFTQSRLWPQITHAWVVYAVDTRGRASDYSNKVMYTTPADTTAPSTPALAATFVGPTRVMLDWTDSVDDVSAVRYQIEIDGAPWATVDQSNQTVIGLTPSTTYVFTVAARDQWNNTARSNSVTVTTPAATNASPPTAPGLSAVAADNCEVWLSWSASADDVDPPGAIVYDIYLNGERISGTIGYTSTVEYGRVTGANTFTVVASDSSGNASAPSNPVTLDLIC